MSEAEKLLKEAKKLPREDRLAHKNWKVRNDANVDLAVICDSMSDPKDLRLREFGPLFRKTVADSNASVQEKALDALIAFLRAADTDADILKCLGDNNKQMRECAFSTLDSWLSAVHLDKMVPYVTAALVNVKIGAEGRRDLFDWLSRQLVAMSEFADAVHLLKPVASALTDKSADVRKAAESCFAEMLRVTKNLKDIQGSALAIVVERLKSCGTFQENFESGRSVSSSVKAGKPSGHGDRASRPGSKAAPRNVTTKVPRRDSILSVQDISFQSQALINVKESNKDERERIIVRRLKFEEMRLEQIQDLENDFMKYFREDLHSRLLSNGFKKQVDGIEMLQKALPSGRDLIEFLDTLFRWFLLRICESNTSCLLKVLEFLPELLDMLSNEGYTITEAEAAIFLPCLVEKCGHNIEKVREKMRELMKQVIHAYSAPKSFPCILEGLRSRNNRTRIECADLVGFLLDNYGAEISGQLKSLQIVASLTAERDGDARKSALNTLATGYKFLGDDIWRYVGKLTEAQRSMLDDRFK